MKRSALYLAFLSLIIDLSAIFFGMLTAYSLRSGGAELYFWPFHAYLEFVLWTMPIWLILFASQGLYNPMSLPRGWNAFGRLLIGLIAGWGGILIILYLWRSPQALVFPRLVIIYGIIWTAVYALVGRIFVAGLINALYQSGIGVTHSVLIGESREGALREEVNVKPALGRAIIAEFPPAGALEKLITLAKTIAIDEVIVSDKIREKDMLDLLNWAETNAANFALVPSLLSVRATNIEMGSLAGTPVMYFLRTPLQGWRRIYKRLLDLILVIPALIILSPLYLLVGLLVKLTSAGPAIFRQARVGQDGRMFYVHKFRSMHADADKRYKKFGGWSADEDSDPRITPFGRFLRRSNLDELPQLWDIFLGSMSIVGPRPEQPKYVEKFAQEIPDYLRRHHVKTGLTGWAQINGLRGDTSITERVKYDLYYIENWSIWFDVRIIISTIILIFRQLLRLTK